MATGPITQIKDLIVPEIFDQYTQLLTTQNSILIDSGVMPINSVLSAKLGGGGTTFNMPAFNDLDDDESRVSTDSVPKAYTGGVADPDPAKITTFKEVATGISRNKSWATSDLAGVLAGADPMAAIAGRVGAYWQRQMQDIFINMMKGVFADNDANPTAGEHVKGDLTYDIKGSSFDATKTAFNTEAFLHALNTMGDNADKLSIIMMHSRVQLTLAMSNLIQTIRDADNKAMYDTFMGRRIVVSDKMPNAGGIYDTWLFGSGAAALGMGSAPVPVEVQRHAGAGNGGGAETLYSRVRWALHPVGYSYMGAVTDGGPTNAVFADKASWQRVYRERKQIRIARLVTREH